MATSHPDNPYESPREAKSRSAEFADHDSSEVADLRYRVSELERRLSRSWVMHPSFLVRAFGVLWYWLIGYGLVGFAGGAIWFSVIVLVWIITGRWLMH